jgi:Ca2+-binding RTX toxin-like protein
MSSDRCEMLEVRRLLASFATLNVRGTLSVVGNGSANTIDVRHTEAQVIATRDGQSQSFARSAVKRVWMHGFGGGDSMTNLTALPTTMIGGGGNDTLRYTGLSNQLFGEGGNDTFANAILEDAAVAANINGGGGFDTFEPSILGTASMPANVERARLLRTDGFTGSSRDDLIEIVGSTFGVTDGGVGNDTIVCVGEPTSVVLVHLRGGSGNDHIRGSQFADLGVGDTLDGGDGNDVIEGQAGFDTITGGPGSDRLFGNAGDDRLDGGTGNDLLFGGTGNDLLIGGAGRDQLHGQAGDDRLEAQDGEIDTLFGGAGEDVLLADPIDA